MSNSSDHGQADTSQSELRNGSQGRISAVLGLDKLAWNSILPEYDPYKYNSFAINAGDQSYRLTLAIDERLDRLSKRKQLNGFPRVIAFQSAVDATVSVRAVIENFFERLPEFTVEAVRSVDR